VTCAPLESARNPTHSESDGATQKVGEKQHTSWALSHFALLLLSRLAGQRERERGLMEEEEEEEEEEEVEEEER